MSNELVPHTAGKWQPYTYRQEKIWWDLLFSGSLLLYKKETKVMRKAKDLPGIHLFLQKAVLITDIEDALFF